MSKLLLPDPQLGTQASSSIECAFLSLKLPTPGKKSGRGIECSAEMLNEITEDRWEVDYCFFQDNGGVIAILKRWR